MTGEGAVASGSGTAVLGSSTAEDWLCSGVLGIISSAAGTEMNGTAAHTMLNAVSSLLADLHFSSKDFSQEACMLLATNC